MLTPGTYAFGADTARLTVRTGRTGAAAKAGHNLLMEVTTWSGSLRIGADPGQTEVTLTADPGSLVVLEGTGGMQSLGDEEKASINQTIQDEVLKGQPISYRSAAAVASAGDERLTVHGELELFGTRRPLSFELTEDGSGRLRGHATVTQTDFGVKPYSALFGTLKVVDEVQVQFEAAAPAAS